MSVFLLLKLEAVLISIALAAGILARDRGLVANRLAAGFFMCNAWWAGCEFLAYQAEDPDVAARLFRWMSLGWVPLGALYLSWSLCLASLRDHLLVRLTPVFYLAVCVAVPIAMRTDWVVESLSHHGTHWQPAFGPAFAFVYAAMMAPLAGALSCWRHFMTLPGSTGQNAFAHVVFWGIPIAIILGTMPAIIGPTFGFVGIEMTTFLLSFFGVAAAGVLNRFGYSLISPEAYAREIFETLGDGVVVIGNQGLVHDVNAAFARLVEDTEGALVGRSMTSLFPDFPERLSELEEATLLDLRTASGRLLPVILLAPVVVGRIHANAFVVRDRREVISLQRQLAVSGRLAAVGDLSKSISESIRQPAADTRRQLEGLGRQWRSMMEGLDAGDVYESASEGIELISECIGGIDRVDAIVNEVGSFSTQTREGSLDCHELSEIVDAALRIARIHAGPHVTIEAKLDSNVRVMCYRSELERVVTNVLVNALHALEKEEEEEERTEGHLTMAVCAQGGRALIHLEDDGCGIAPEVLERVFDPFFTTKPVGKGTGLGLAISYHIVRKHGGQIRISSVEHAGTSVAIELPRYDIGLIG